MPKDSNFILWQSTFMRFTSKGAFYLSCLRRKMQLPYNSIFMFTLILHTNKELGHYHTSNKFFFLPFFFLISCLKKKRTFEKVKGKIKYTALTEEHLRHCLVLTLDHTFAISDAPAITIAFT